MHVYTNPCRYHRTLTGQPFDHVTIVLDGGLALHVGPPTIRLLPVRLFLQPQREPRVLRPRIGNYSQGRDQGLVGEGGSLTRSHAVTASSTHESKAGNNSKEAPSALAGPGPSATAQEAGAAELAALLRRCHQVVGLPYGVRRGWSLVANLGARRIATLLSVEADSVVRSQAAPESTAPIYSSPFSSPSLSSSLSPSISSSERQVGSSLPLSYYRTYTDKTVCTDLILSLLFETCPSFRDSLLYGPSRPFRPSPPLSAVEPAATSSSSSPSIRSSPTFTSTDSATGADESHVPPYLRHRPAGLRNLSDSSHSSHRSGPPWAERHSAAVWGGPGELRRLEPRLDRYLTGTWSLRDLDRLSQLKPHVLCPVALPPPPPPLPPRQPPPSPLAHPSIPPPPSRPASLLEGARTAVLELARRCTDLLGEWYLRRFPPATSSPSSPQSRPALSYSHPFFPVFALLGLWTLRRLRRGLKKLILCALVLSVATTLAAQEQGGALHEKGRSVGGDGVVTQGWPEALVWLGRQALGRGFLPSLRGLYRAAAGAKVLSSRL